MLRNLQNFVPGPFSGGRKIESTWATLLLCFVGRVISIPCARHIWQPDGPLCYPPHVLTSFLTGELTAVGISSVEKYVWQGYSNLIRTAEEAYAYYEKDRIIARVTIRVIISKRK
jgi:hypothetical protein